MLTFAGKRVGRLVLVLLAVAVGTFAIGRLLPGDLVTTLLGENATPARVAQVRAQLGLDQPLVTQFWQWLSGAVRGDFGASPLSGISISASIAQRVPVSLELLVISEVFALVLAVPTAVWAAYRRGRLGDAAANDAAFLLLATPQFVVGIVLILVFAVKLQLLPATGYVYPGDDLLGSVRSLLLPAIALGLGSAARYFRVLRNDVSATLQQPFILVARAEGMAPRTILFRYALRPSMLTLLTVVGLDIGLLIGGAVIIEQLFALPGMGTFAINSVLQRDLSQLQAVVLVIAAFYVVVNLVVDVLYGVLDPRIRHAR